MGFVFKTVGLEEAGVSQFQKNTEESFKEIFLKEILNGQILQDIALTTSFQNIPHLLQRPLVGYLVIMRDANSVVFDDEANNTMKDKFVRLRGSANVNVNLWVF